VRAYLDTYVYGPGNHADYLDLFDEKARRDAAVRARTLTNP
jgi:hypothetical protein